MADTFSYLLARFYLSCIARKRISAMMRVKNEEEFLAASVDSIIDHVDEVVLVDNLSTDRTPQIIQQLRSRYPHKISVYSYPYEIRRVGHENWELAEDPSTRSSPHLSANFYNWCLRKCRMPYILKWDGDMVAIDGFTRVLNRWRQSPMPVAVFFGANVHPQGQRLAAARETDRQTLMQSLRVAGMPRWVTGLTYDYPEHRLHPKVLTKYGNRLLWTQSLTSPLIQPQRRERCCIESDEPCYLHLKFCKKDALANYSPDLQKVIADNIVEGPPLEAEWRQLLESLHLQQKPNRAAEKTTP